MGQKTHPIGFRLGIVKTWSSKWYEEKNFAKWLHEDIRLKKFVKKKLEHAGVAGVDVERAANKAKINIYTARPGIVIGKRGAGVEPLQDRDHQPGAVEPVPAAQRQRGRIRHRQLVLARRDVEADPDHHRGAAGLGEDPGELLLRVGVQQIVGPLQRQPQPGLVPHGLVQRDAGEQR